MARKNIFGFAADLAPPEEAQSSEIQQKRPLADFERPQKRATPVGAISQSLGGISERAKRADEMEKKLAAGHLVVDLDPSLIDISFVTDRLGITAANVTELVEQIREHGQQVPILVRPHPEKEGRYQVAYGHRRLAATQAIGIPVKAVVRQLTDEQLVISQGQENNARTDLTFIERSFFAYRLEERGFSRDVIMSALGVDKAALSRMIALIVRLPSHVIEAIGPAPSIGRTKWAELADLLAEEHYKKQASKLINDPGFQSRESDDRFEKLLTSLRAHPSKPRTANWQDEAGRKLVRINETEQKLNLVFDKGKDAAFGKFVESRLPALFDEFVALKTTE